MHDAADLAGRPGHGADVGKLFRAAFARDAAGRRLASGRAGDLEAAGMPRSAAAGAR